MSDQNTPPATPNNDFQDPTVNMIWPEESNADLTSLLRSLALQADSPINPSDIKTLPGKGVDYLPKLAAITELYRVFGSHNVTIEISELTRDYCGNITTGKRKRNTNEVYDEKSIFLVSYTARCAITVRIPKPDGTEIIVTKSDYGSASIITENASLDVMSSPVTALTTCPKSAASVALKRAIALFGRRFGLNIASGSESEAEEAAGRGTDATSLAFGGGGSSKQPTQKQNQTPAYQHQKPQNQTPAPQNQPPAEPVQPPECPTINSNQTEVQITDNLVQYYKRFQHFAQNTPSANTVFSEYRKFHLSYTVPQNLPTALLETLNKYNTTLVQRLIANTPNLSPEQISDLEQMRTLKPRT